MPSSSTKPKKVVLHADENFIKHLYAEHDQDYNQQQRSYYRPTATYSFTPPSSTTISSTNNNTKTTNNSSTTSIRHKKTAELISRRIHKFYTLFDPMINFLLMNRYALYNKQYKIDVESMPEDYVMVVHLMDCAAKSNNNNDDGDSKNGSGGGGDCKSSSKGGRAQQQLLRIDKLEPRAISDLNEKERLSLQRDLSSNKQQSEEEFLLPHLVSYTVPTTTTTTTNNNNNNKNDAAAGYIWTSIRTNSYDFNPLIIGRVSQKALMGRCIAFAQGINDIARGERPDLYEMIKRQMKEVRRSKKMMTTMAEKDEMSLRGVGGASRNRNGVTCSHSWNEDDESENKENVDPNAKTTIRKNGNENCTGLKELNRSTKVQSRKDENRIRVRKSVL